MSVFEFLGVTPAESIGLIKKISKKKIKPEDFKKLLYILDKHFKKENFFFSLNHLMNVIAESLVLLIDLRIKNITSVAYHKSDCLNIFDCQFAVISFQGPINKILRFLTEMTFIPENEFRQSGIIADGYLLKFTISTVKIP